MATSRFVVIDGASRRGFGTLAKVAEYVRSQWMGEDYIRSWGLQGEYGEFTFVGFSWSDLGMMRRGPDGEGTFEWLPEFQTEEERADRAALDREVMEDSCREYVREPYPFLPHPPVHWSDPRADFGY